MLSFLQRPYPSDHDLKHGFITAIGISIFLIIFFLIFKPFGIGNIPFDARVKAILLYGFVNFIATFSVLTLLKYIFPTFHKEEKWVIWKEIFSFLLLFIAITFGCLTVNAFFFNDPFRVNHFFLFFLYVLTFGSLPIGFSIIMKYTRNLKKNLAEAQSINQAISTTNTSPIPEKKAVIISLNSANKHESLALESKQFYFAESSANYVTIHYIKEGNIKKKILRTTMKILMKDFESQSNIVRCHRSFIVNLEYIQNIEGDSRGYEISLNDLSSTVPVSRSYILTIKAFLQMK